MQPARQMGFEYLHCTLDGCPNHRQTSDRMSALQLHLGKAAVPPQADNRAERGAVKRPTLQG